MICLCAQFLNYGSNIPLIIAVNLDVKSRRGEAAEVLL
jgi:hypothetical protein